MHIMNAPPQAAVASASWGIPSCETAVEWLDTGPAATPAEARISRFTGVGEVSEWNVTVSLKDRCEDPVAALEDAWLAALDSARLSPDSTLMRRVFCSDAVNQFPLLESFARNHPGAFSAIGQTPLAGGKHALWSYHLTDPRGPLQVSGGGSRFSCERGPLRHCWNSGLCDTTGSDAFSQTGAVLEEHNRWLAGHDMTLAENVIRTWWFVRDIDADYQGLVDARRVVFDRHGLTQKTRYIASTGIAGTHPERAARLSLDSYAIRGLVPGQIEHLSAPDYLGPTHMYGVTFERATAISYADRRQVLISGTASIDASGNIVHPGDVLRQLDRTLENIAALLAAARAGMGDLAMILVYLRDPADGPLVEKTLRHRLGGVPMILLHAPVCRPGWLIEIEGTAILAAGNPKLPDF
jgi:enamine deaminase RidA (YjgF/YER057c/UK114 family)